MADQKNRLTPRTLSAPFTRRQMISGSAAALGGVALLSPLSASADAQQAMAEKPDTGDQSIWLHQEVDFKAIPQRIYEALLDGKQFSAFSGAPATISREPGGAFSLFGGHIVGRNIELTSNQRIIQAWRVVTWDEGIYSIARFELKAQGSGTHLVFDHTGFPAGKKEHLAAGWQENYWQKLQKYLS
jgi:activator of HSP90 ATPase